MKQALVVLALVASCFAASAQTVWRCGADGRSYSDAPCADGRAIDASDVRSAEQQQQARGVAARDRRLADQLRSERIARAQAPAPGYAVIGSSTASRLPETKREPLLKQPQKPRLSKRHRSESGDGTFRAAAPGSRRAKG
jgi:hypothetical protein